MQLERKLMGDALRATVIPYLREVGFAGTLPHFRRKRSGRHELLSIMFNKYGGSFYVEAGAMSGERYVELQRHWATAGKKLPESKLDIGHCEWIKEFVLARLRWIQIRITGLSLAPIDLPVALYCRLRTMRQ